MPAGYKFRAIDGTFVSPVTAFQALRGVVGRRPDQVRSTTNPSDSHNYRTVVNRYIYFADLIGVYVEGSDASKTLNESQEGTLTITLGGGEKWTGTFAVHNMDATPAWDGQGEIPVKIRGIWQGKPTIAQP